MQYCNIFRDIPTVLERSIKDKVVSHECLRALWCLQMAHPPKTMRVPLQKRLVGTDNFSTRHLLANQLLLSTGNETKMLSTERMNNFDGMSRLHLTRAIKEITHSERGRSVLCPTYQKRDSEDDDLIVEEKAGYVFFKDRNVFRFYTNELHDTPNNARNKAAEHAIECVHVLAPLLPCTGD